MASASAPVPTDLVTITPTRVYDSRFDMAPDVSGPLAGGSNRTISVANSRDINSGEVSGEAIPASATAVAFTLTVTSTKLAGYLAVNPGGISTVSASTINWFAADLSLANTGVVQLGPNRTLTVVHGGAGSTEFIIDLVGYYVPDAPSPTVPGGGSSSAATVKTANHTVTTADSTVIGNTAAGGFTVTLPTAVGAVNAYTVKKSAAANTLTIATTGGQTIDGSTTIAITRQYEAITVVSDGTNWVVI